MPNLEGERKTIGDFATAVAEAVADDILNDFPDQPDASNAMDRDIGDLINTAIDHFSDTYGVDPDTPLDANDMGMDDGSDAGLSSGETPVNDDGSDMDGDNPIDDDGEGEEGL